MENDKIEKAEYRQKFERELETIEEQWRSESKELMNLVSRLQEENRRLIKGQGQGQEVQQQISAQEDGDVLQNLKTMLEKQREELKTKDKLLEEKCGDVDLVIERNKPAALVNNVVAFVVVQIAGGTAD